MELPIPSALACAKNFCTIPISPLSLGPKVLRLGFAINVRFGNSVAVRTSLVLDWSLITSSRYLTLSKISSS